ncbi:Odorant receptor 4 [Anthophora plagiata]
MQKAGTDSVSTRVSIEYDYNSNVKLSVQLSRWILKPLGVWPNSANIPTIERYFYWLINVICYSLITFLLIPCSLYVILEIEDVYNKIKLLGPLNFCVMAFLKYHMLVVYENDIRECIERIEWDWKNITYSKDKDIMIENAIFGRRLIIICTFFMYSGFAFYYIAIPISVGRIPAQDANVTFIPMVYPFSRFIVDTRYSPINEILFSLQVLAGCLMHSITSAACSLAAMFAAHACGQMQVLMSWLKHLINGRSDMCSNVDRRIAKIVNQHVRILQFLTHTQKALQQVSFVEFLGSVLNICLLGYYIIMEWSSSHMTNTVTYIVLLMSLTFNIFIFCYIGELVAEQCEKIGQVSYMIDWYRLTGNKKLCCVLIIAMSHSSMKLTAGNIVELCLTTFGDVVKTAVAFLNALRTLT